MNYHAEYCDFKSAYVVRDLRTGAMAFDLNGGHYFTTSLADAEHYADFLNRRAAHYSR